MKLCNKKTGEIVTKIDVSQDHQGIWVLENKLRFYKTLAELNEEWEDYEEKEPLIKDEKIRKIIRLWAEVNKSNKLFVGCDWAVMDEKDYMIEFTDDNVFDFPSGQYTIAELCGEEE